ncbi:hypothetical protein IAT38_003718 [Cryptococcus sp. DSM 104549]
MGVNTTTTSSPGSVAARTSSFASGLSRYASTHRLPSLSLAQRSTLSTIESDPEATQHMINLALTAASVHDVAWASGESLSAVRELIEAEAEARGKGNDDFEDVLRDAAGERGRRTKYGKTRWAGNENVSVSKISSTMASLEDLRQKAPRGECISSAAVRRLSLKLAGLADVLQEQEKTAKKLGWEK